MELPDLPPPPPPPPSPCMERLGEALLAAYARWEDDEVERLLRAVRQNGTSWRRIAQEMGGLRSAEALRARFNRMRRKKDGPRGERRFRH